MKIPQSIIEKYNLTPSENHIGEAIYNNLQCYKSSIPEFKDVLFMECDLMGKPSQEITLYNKSMKRKISVTPEYLEAMKIGDILRFVV